MHSHTLLDLSSLVVLSSDVIVVISQERNIIIWQVSMGQQFQTLEGHSGDIRCLGVLSDRRLVAGSKDKTLRIWS